MKGNEGVIWLAIPVMLAGCDLVQDRYRMEFRDGSGGRSPSPVFRRRAGAGCRSGSGGR